MNPQERAAIAAVAAPIHEKNIQARIQEDINTILPLLIRNPQRTSTNFKDEPKYQDLKNTIRDLRTRFTDSREHLGFTRKSRPLVVYIGKYRAAVSSLPIPEGGSAIEPLTVAEFEALGVEVKEAPPPAAPMTLEDLNTLVQDYMARENLEHIVFHENGEIREQEKPVRPAPRTHCFTKKR